jgi:arylamine N-acetyltransferase
MNVQDYLDRIGFKESPKVDYETLEKLQQCHQMSVPFENLIAMAGKMTNLTA